MNVQRLKATGCCFFFYWMSNNFVTIGHCFDILSQEESGRLILSRSSNSCNSCRLVVAIHPLQSKFQGCDPQESCGVEETNGDNGCFAAKCISVAESKIYIWCSEIRTHPKVYHQCKRLLEKMSTLRTPDGFSWSQLPKITGLVGDSHQMLPMPHPDTTNWE